MRALLDDKDDRAEVVKQLFWLFVGGTIAAVSNRMRSRIGLRSKQVGLQDGTRSGSALRSESAPHFPSTTSAPSDGPSRFHEPDREDPRDAAAIEAAWSRQRVLGQSSPFRLYDSKNIVESLVPVRPGAHPAASFVVQLARCGFPARVLGRGSDHGRVVLFTYDRADRNANEGAWILHEIAVSGGGAAARNARQDLVRIRWHWWSQGTVMQVRGAKRNPFLEDAGQFASGFMKGFTAQWQRVPTEAEREASLPEQFRMQHRLAGDADIRLALDLHERRLRQAAGEWLQALEAGERSRPIELVEALRALGGVG